MEVTLSASLLATAFLVIYIIYRSFIHNQSEDLSGRSKIATIVLADIVADIKNERKNKIQGWLLDISKYCNVIDRMVEP